MIKNSKIISAIIIPLVASSLYAGATQKDIKAKLKIEVIEKYGSSLETKLEFKEYPFLEITSTNAYFDKQNKEPLILVSIKNNYDKKINIEKIFNPGYLLDNELEPSQSTKLIIKEKEFNKYLTKLSNESYKKEKLKLKNIQRSMKSLMAENKAIQKIADNFLLNIEKLKLEKNQLKVEKVYVENLISDLIYKFPLETINLGKIVITGEGHKEIKTLKIEEKIALLNYLITEKIIEASNYTVSENKEEILKEKIAIKLENEFLKHQEELEKPYYKELKEKLKGENLLLNKNEKISILKSILIKLKKMEIDIHEKQEKIVELTEENKKLSKEIKELKEELKKSEEYAKNLEKEIEEKEILKIQKNNYELENKVKDLTTDIKNLKAKQIDLLTENKELFKKYDNAASKYDEIMKENMKLKKKIKELKSLL